MATSLGYVLMNWTSTFSKKKHKKKPVNKKPDTDTVCCQTIGETIIRLFDRQGVTISCVDIFKKATLAFQNVI